MHGHIASRRSWPAAALSYTGTFQRRPKQKSDHSPARRLCGTRWPVWRRPAWEQPAAPELIGGLRNYPQVPVSSKSSDSGRGEGGGGSGSAGDGRHFCGAAGSTCQQRPSTRSPTSPCCHPRPVRSLNPRPRPSSLSSLFLSNLTHRAPQRAAQPLPNRRVGDVASHLPASTENKAAEFLCGGRSSMGWAAGGWSMHATFAMEPTETALAALRTEQLHACELTGHTNYSHEDLGNGTISLHHMAQCQLKQPFKRLT